MEIKELFEKFDELGKKFAGFKDEVFKRLDEVEAKLNRPKNFVAKEGDEEKTLRKKAYLNYLRAGDVYKLAPEEQKALVGDDSTNAILVPEEYYSEIITNVKHNAIIRQFATSLPLKGNKLNVRSMTDMTMAWGRLEVGEQTLGDNTPSVSKEAIEIKDLVGLVKLGKNLLADTDVALERYIVSQFGNRAGYYEDKAFLLGDGNLEPLGVLNDTDITQVTTANAGTIGSDDIIDMYFALKEVYRRNAIWIMSSSVEKALRKLKDNNGNYLLIRDLSSPTGRTLLGRPVFNFDDMSGTIATGEDVILFGDFTTGFIILDKVNGMATQRLNELYATSNQVGILFYHRVGGGVIVPESFTKLTVS
jgi:HK97 family phage major capsid protein